MEATAAPVARRGFWQGSLGVVLRWVLYVPVGFAALLLAQILSVIFLRWLFHDGRDVFVIGLLLGGLVVVPFLIGTCFLLAHLIAEICPAPRPGMTVFAVLYCLNQLTVIFQPSPDWLVITAALVSACVVIAAAVQAWGASR